MEIKIERLEHDGDEQTYSDAARLSIPLSTISGFGMLDLSVRERVRYAGTRDANFQLDITVIHRHGGKRAIIVNQTIYNDEVELDEQDRMRQALQEIAKPSRGSGIVMDWVAQAQTTARRALFPDYVADGSWGWDEHGPIIPEEHQ